MFFAGCHAVVEPTKARMRLMPDACPNCDTELSNPNGYCSCKRADMRETIAGLRAERDAHQAAMVGFRHEMLKAVNERDRYRAALERILATKPVYGEPMHAIAREALGLSDV